MPKRIRLKSSTTLFLLVTLLVVLTAIWFFYLSPMLKQQQFRAALNQPTTQKQVNALKKYLNRYPHSQNLPQVYLKILQLQYHQLDQKTTALRNWGTWLTTDPSPAAQQALLSFYGTLPDSGHSLATVSKQYTRTSAPLDPHRQKILFLIDTFLNSNLPDSSLQAELLRLTNLLIQSEWHDPRGYLKVATALLPLNTPAMTRQSSRLLHKAIQVNTRPSLSRSGLQPDEKNLQQQLNTNYYALYSALSRNAYRLENYSLALHLISQAAKYQPRLSEEDSILWKSIAAQLN